MWAKGEGVKRGSVRMKVKRQREQKWGERWHKYHVFRCSSHWSSTNAAQTSAHTITTCLMWQQCICSALCICLSQSCFCILILFAPLPTRERRQNPPNFLFYTTHFLIWFFFSSTDVRAGLDQYTQLWKQWKHDNDVWRFHLDINDALSCWQWTKWGRNRYVYNKGTRDSVHLIVIIFSLAGK